MNSIYLLTYTIESCHESLTQHLSLINAKKMAAIQAGGFELASALRDEENRIIRLLNKKNRNLCHKI